MCTNKKELILAFKNKVDKIEINENLKKKYLNTINFELYFIFFICAIMLLTVVFHYAGSLANGIVFTKISGSFIAVLSSILAVIVTIPLQRNIQILKCIKKIYKLKEDNSKYYLIRK